MWIIVKKPFDYLWPSGAITAFDEKDLGDHFVKAELGDFALAGGYATGGKTDDESRSAKGKKEKPTVKAADPGIVTPVDNKDRADDDRPADRGSVGRDAD